MHYSLCSPGSFPGSQVFVHETDNVCIRIKGLLLFAIISADPCYFFNLNSACNLLYALTPYPTINVKSVYIAYIIYI